TEAATRNAERAEEAAATSPNREEADRQRQIAQVWREVAEQLRRENEALKKKLDETLAHAKSTVENAMSRLGLDDIFRLEGERLQIQSDALQKLLPPPTSSRRAMDLIEAAAALQKFGGPNLTRSLARIEASLKGVGLDTCSS